MTELKPFNDLVVKINEKLNQINVAMLSVVPRAMELGDLLKQAKRMVGHGQFITWLESNCPGLPKRTAERYMWYADNRAEIEEKAKEKSANLADLTLGQVERWVKPKAGAAATAPDPVAKAKEIKNKLLDQLKSIRLDDQQKANQFANDVYVDLVADGFLARQETGKG
jgi:hypothetical protein